MPRDTRPLLAPVLLLLCGAVGCNTVYDEWDDCTMQIRDDLAARRAWHESRSLYEDVSHCHDFGKGFQAGYKDIASGGSGCPPALPPRCYWGVCYQSSTGKEKIAAWFEGYSHGVLAAEYDGVRNWVELPVMHQPLPVGPHAHGDHRVILDHPTPDPAASQPAPSPGAGQAPPRPAAPGELAPAPEPTVPDNDEPDNNYEPETPTNAAAGQARPAAGRIASTRSTTSGTVLKQFPVSNSGVSSGDHTAARRGAQRSAVSPNRRRYPVSQNPRVVRRLNW